MDAAAATEQVIKRARGRRDSQGQEGVIKLKPAEDSIQELVDLYVKAGEASDKLNDAIKAVAEKSELLASVVRKFVTARAGEKFEEEKRKCEQLGLLFDEIGLLGGSK